MIEEIAKTRRPRCKSLDADGCRCLLGPDHRGPHDYPYTPWSMTSAGLEEIERAHRERERMLRAARGSLL